MPKKLKGKYKYYVENGNENKLKFNKDKLQNLLVKIQNLENIVKSKLSITNKYNEHLKF